jgi:hypothetical protein
MPDRSRNERAGIARDMAARRHSTAAYTVQRSVRAGRIADRAVQFTDLSAELCARA